MDTHPQLLDVKVLVPDVLDSNGVRISPANYTEICGDGQIVEVEVILKMCVFSNRDEVEMCFNSGINSGGIYLENLLGSMALAAAIRTALGHTSLSSGT